MGNKVAVLYHDKEELISLQKLAGIYNLDVVPVDLKILPPKNRLHVLSEVLPEDINTIITVGKSGYQYIYPTRKEVKWNRPESVVHEKRVFHVIPVISPVQDRFKENTSVMEDIKEGIYIAGVITDNVPPSRPFPKVIEINSPTLLKEALLMIERDKHVGVDIETYSQSGGLEIFDPTFTIVSIAVANETTGYYINAEEPSEDVMCLLRALENAIPVFHNASFDLLALRKVYGFEPKTYEDSMLASYILDENRSKSLKELAATPAHLGWANYTEKIFDELINMGYDIKTIKGDMKNIPFDLVGKYNVYDASATLMLFHMFYTKLNESQKKLYSFLKECNLIFMNASFRGINIDVDTIEEAKRIFMEENDKIKKELSSTEAGIKTRKAIYLIEKNKLSTEKIKKGDFSEVDAYFADKDAFSSIPLSEINFNSKIHILLMMHFNNVPLPEDRTETGEVSLSQKDLNLDGTPLEALSRLKKNEKLISTFLDGLLDDVCPDGKVHPKFSFVGTKTGRLSCSNPNLQQIPDGVIRDLFYAPDPYVFYQYDFSQAELRVLANLTGDEKLIEVLNSGVDFHSQMASIIFHIPLEQITKESKERKMAKSLVFGTIYGVSPQGFAKNSGISPEEATRIIDNFYKMFPKVRDYIETIHQKALTTGVITTFFGRSRRLPEVFSPNRAQVNSALRQAQNFPIQSIASDINLLLIYMAHKKGCSDFSEFLLSVHDSALFLVLPEDVPKLHQLLNTCLTKINERFKFKVPMLIEAKIGKRWGSLVEYKGGAVDEVSGLR